MIPPVFLQRLPVRGLEFARVDVNGSSAAGTPNSWSRSPSDQCGHPQNQGDKAEDRGRPRPWLPSSPSGITATPLTFNSVQLNWTGRRRDDDWIHRPARHERNSLQPDRQVSRRPLPPIPTRARRRSTPITITKSRPNGALVPSGLPHRPPHPLRWPLRRRLSQRQPGRPACN